MHSWLRQRGRRVLTTILLPMMLASCSGNTNSTGPAAPLPTGQPGALTLWTGTDAGCYVQDGSTSNSCTSPPGTNPVTAVATFSSASPTTGGTTTTNDLLMGDSAGNLTVWTVPDSTSYPTYIASCTSSPTGSSIQGIATAYASSASTVYFVSGGNLYSASLTSTSCSTNSSPNGSTGSSVVGLALANGYVYGISTSGEYFSIQAGQTASSAFSSHGTLPNLPSTAVIGGMTADTNGYVFVTDYANSAIYAYYASNGSLALINGTLSGNVDVTNPKAITTVYAPFATSSGCTTTGGPCEFLYVTNYSQAVVQLVLSISGSGTSTSIGYTEFNAPYTDCEIINPLAMASFTNVDSTSSQLQAPWVFIPQNGTVTGTCQSFTSSTKYGNGVTAYNLTP